MLPTESTPPLVASQESDDTYARIGSRAELSCLICHEGLRDQMTCHISALHADFSSERRKVSLSESDFGNGTTTARQESGGLTRGSGFCHDDSAANWIGLEAIRRENSQARVRCRASNHGCPFEAVMTAGCVS